MEEKQTPPPKPTEAVMVFFEAEAGDAGIEDFGGEVDQTIDSCRAESLATLAVDSCLSHLPRHPNETIDALIALRTLSEVFRVLNMRTNLVRGVSDDEDETGDDEFEAFVRQRKRGNPGRMIPPARHISDGQVRKISGDWARRQRRLEKEIEHEAPLTPGVTDEDVSESFSKALHYNDDAPPPPKPSGVFRKSIATFIETICGKCGDPQRLEPLFAMAVTTREKVASLVNDIRRMSEELDAPSDDMD